MGMDPRPARAYGVETPQYITPDRRTSSRMGDEFVVTLNDDGLPRLRISGLYKEAVGEHPQGGKVHPRAHALGAQWLIRSIQQRQRTIVKVTKSILKFQRDFFERGPQHLRPLILKACRRGHRDARVHGLAGDDQPIRPHPAGNLRAQVFLQRRHQPHHRRRPRQRGGQGASKSSSTSRTRLIRTVISGSSSSCRRKASTSPGGRSPSTASNSACSRARNAVSSFEPDYLALSWPCGQTIRRSRPLAGAKPRKKVPDRCRLTSFSARWSLQPPCAATPRSASRRSSATSPSRCG